MKAKVDLTTLSQALVADAEKEGKHKVELKDRIKKLKEKRVRKEEKFNSEREKKAERLENTAINKKILDEWLPVVKKNREKEHLDFSQDLGLNEFRMQAKAHDQKKSKLTAFESILADKLQSLGIAKEADLIKKESELIKSKDLDTNGLSTSIAESESAAARTRQLYGELKAKRQAKIKSKVYRAIKKRERNKLASKQADLAEGNSDEEAKEADRDRAQERLTLRHRNKTKFTDQLKRYANQKEVQKMYSDLNKERQKILKKIDMDVYAELASDDSDYEQEELDTKAIADIEAAFEDDTKEGPSDDIVAELARRGRENMRQEAEKLIASIKGEEGIKAEGRQKFKREEKLVEEKKKDVVHLAQAESGLELLKRMNREENGDLGKRESQSGLPGIAIDSKVNLPNKKVKQAAVNLKEDLLEGIEIGALKEKYKKSSKGKTFKEEDMEAFRLENEEDEYLGGHEQVVMAGKENVQEFEQEKEDELMKEVVEEKKPLKGWGDWTGAGIVERKVDPEVELEKKRQQIAEIKRRRQDGNNKNVILNENRNKEIAQYMVDRLPHPFQNKEQFDYLSSMPVGKEWTGILQHDRIIRPAVKTRAGEIIEPITKK